MGQCWPVETTPPGAREHPQGISEGRRAGAKAPPSLPSFSDPPPHETTTGTAIALAVPVVRFRLIAHPARQLRRSPMTRSNRMKMLMKSRYRISDPTTANRLAIASFPSVAYATPFSFCVSYAVSPMKTNSAT